MQRQAIGMLGSLGVKPGRRSELAARERRHRLSVSPSVAARQRCNADLRGLIHGLVRFAKFTGDEVLHRRVADNGPDTSPPHWHGFRTAARADRLTLCSTGSRLTPR
jgi:hypothetical protein